MSLPLLNWISAGKGPHYTPAYHKKPTPEDPEMVDSWIVSTNGPYATMPFRLITATESHTVVLSVLRDFNNKDVHVFAGKGIVIKQGAPVPAYAWSAMCSSAVTREGIRAALAEMHPGFSMCISSGLKVMTPMACDALTSAYADMLLRRPTEFHDLCFMMTEHLKA
jgi:hypothetical protein